MGINQSKEKITRTDILNQIDIEVENETKNITEVLNESVTNISMSVVNETASKINNAVGGGNNLLLKNVNIDGVLNINQEVNIEATTQAVIQLIQDSSALNDMASQMIQDISNKVENDNELNSTIQQVTAVNQSKKDEGGIASMVKMVTDVLNTALTPGSKMTESNYTNIKNTVKQKLSNTTINKNDIKNIVKNSIENNIKNINESTCQTSVSAANNMELNGVNIGANGKATLDQITSVTAFNSCLISTLNTAEISSKIANTSSTTNKNETTNKNKTTAGVSQAATVTQSEELNDFILSAITNVTDSMTSGSIGSIICGLFCLIYYIIIAGAIGYFAYKRMGN